MDSMQMKPTLMAAALALTLLAVSCSVLERAEEGSAKVSKAAVDTAENTLCDSVLGSTDRELQARYDEAQSAALAEFCASIE